MTIFIEISNPVQWKPWKYKSHLMYRVGWLWFAFSLLRVPFREYASTPKVWEDC